MLSTFVGLVFLFIYLFSSTLSQLSYFRDTNKQEKNLQIVA